MTGRRGINLLELILAVTLFAGVAVGLLGVWATHARATAKAQNYLIARAFLEQTMESQLARGWAAEPMPEAEVSVTHIVEGKATRAVYYRSCEVVDLGGAQLGLKKVVVTIQWDEEGQRRQVKAAALLSWEG